MLRKVKLSDISIHFLLILKIQMVTQFVWAPCGTILYIETALYTVCAYMYVLGKSSQECIYKTLLTFKEHQEFKFSLIVVFG